MYLRKNINVTKIELFKYWKVILEFSTTHWLLHMYHTYVIIHGWYWILILLFKVCLLLQSSILGLSTWWTHWLRNFWEWRIGTSCTRGELMGGWSHIPVYWKTSLKVLLSTCILNYRLSILISLLNCERKFSELWLLYVYL